MQRRVLYILTLCMLFVSCVKHSHDGANKLCVDSLYTELSATRYSNITAFDSLATELQTIADDDNELQMVANNAMAYSAMMQMDYARSVELYRFVHDNSACEIERLVADVGLMTICYRVSANRLFFDYRSTALSRIKRINEEYEYLAASDKERFNRAKVEFGIVSVCYFSNLSMQNETERILEYLERNIKDVEEMPLRLYARLMLCKNIPDAQKRLSQLSTGLSIAENADITWLEANYRLLLAISLRDSYMLQLFAKEFPDRVTLLLPKEYAIEEFPSLLAESAAEAFASYGDEYMTIEALAVQASCCTRLEKHEESLSLLAEAYDRISLFYQNKGLKWSPEELDSLLYNLNETDALVTEIDADIYHIPECLLSVCREASCAYAGLGEKELSDINRDIYLTLLSTTRLNKHLESRVSMMENKVSNLEITAAIVIVLLIALSFFLFFVYRRRMIREKQFSVQRKNLLRVCHLLFSSLPHNIDNKEQLTGAISAILNENMGEFSGRTEFAVSDTLCESELPYNEMFNISYTNSNNNDKLFVASEKPLNDDKQSLMTMLIPYIAVAIEEGMRLYDISEEREKVEEAKRASAIYLAEHKQENILKRVSVSIVSNMRTFMDRISNELKNLTAVTSVEDGKRKLQYVSELTEKLGDLNLILERWIKNRQGEVNLRIENISIGELFEIIGHNRKLFDARGLELVVKPSTSVAKADRALTLFMINTLVDNASKFTPSGGCIVLECIEGDGFVEIAVTDTGIGMSQDDVDCILGTKVYDASLIGKDNEYMNPKSKGSGFGIMNCKGIIEKYKKTDSFFSVCSFDISSTRGKGSRFSFRLPKGIIRCLLLFLSLWPIQMSANENLFVQLNKYADSVFMCNVEERHAEAFIFAQEALDLLNSYYMAEIGGDDTLSLHSGKAAELSWWRNSIYEDSLKEEIFYNILDIRNEVAVALLALNNWDSYNYNNNIYSTLYRLIHEDKDIADYYATIQQVANRYNVTIAFACFLILLLLIYYITTFVRHNIISKTNERLVLDMNNRLLNVTTRNGRRTIADLAQDIVDELYECMGETMRIKEIALLLNNDNGKQQVLVAAPSASMHKRNDIYIQRTLEKGEPVILSSGTMRTIPLYTMNGGERISVGVLEVKTERPLNENETVSLEFVSSYLASVAYHSAVRVASGYIALEELEEEAERMRYEENRLHVQNMVMDNCLSVIKHETVYYPSRIRELANHALLLPNNSAVADMCELMKYYSSIFGILSNCAVRELDGTSFKLTKVSMSELFNNAKRIAERLLRKSDNCVEVTFEKSDAVVLVDTDLVDFLFGQLFTATFKIKKDGKILLRAIDSGELVTIELVDNRYEMTNDEAAELFTPTKRNIDNIGGVDAMEYLVAKEIVRLHEDYTGKHGGRMEARSDISGTVILFTFPKHI